MKTFEFAIGTSNTPCTRSYRYGFNGQEKDNEVAGTGNITTAEFWEYDSRLGRRFNIDPVTKTPESPYATIGNNPIWFSDQNGADTLTFTKNSTTVNYKGGLDGITNSSTTTSSSLNIKQAPGEDVFYWNVNITTISENGTSSTNSTSTQFYPNSNGSSNLSKTCDPYIGLLCEYDKDEVFLGKLMVSNRELSDYLISHNSSYRKHAAIGATYKAYDNMKMTMTVVSAFLAGRAIAISLTDYNLIYRVVSASEAEDVMYNGFRQAPFGTSSYEGKLFWTNIDDAQWYLNWVGEGNQIMKIKVNRNFGFEYGSDAGRPFLYVPPQNLKMFNAAIKSTK